MKSPKLNEIHDLDFVNFQSYIKDKISLIKNQPLNKFNSITKYHETVIDISDELKMQIQNKQNEILNQVNKLYEYYFELNEIVDQITKQINYHEDELNKLKKKIDLGEINDLFTAFKDRNCKPELKQPSLNTILCNLKHMITYIGNDKIIDEAIKEQLLTSWFKFKFIDLFETITT